MVPGRRCGPKPLLHHLRLELILMILDSLIDAWGIALGLKAATILWDVFSDSGVILIPLIFTFIKGAERILLEGYDDATYRSVVYKIFAVWFVFVLAVMPSASFRITDIRTIPKACASPEAQVSQALKQSDNESPGGSKAIEVLQEKYDAVIAGEPVYVSPLVWATLAVSQSIKNESVSRLPCATDIRLIRSEMASTSLPTDTRQEVSEFVRKCYWPGRRKSIELGFFPPEEFLWPAHKSFLEIVGIYDNADGDGFYSTTARFGFSNSINTLAETERLPAGYGFPNCKEWWIGIDGDQEHSLRYRLFELTPEWVREEEEGVSAMISGWFKSDEEAEAYLDQRDAIISKVFFTNKSAADFGFTGATDYGLDSGNTGFMDYTSRLLGTIGVTLGSIPQTAGVSMLQLTAPIAKPLILLIVLTAYVPAMLVGALQGKHVLTFMTVIASIMFWPFLWELGRLVDDTLLEATGGVLMGSLGINQAMISQWLAGFFFIYGPALFTMALGWVGMAGSDMVQTKIKGASSAGSAGQRGASKAASAGKSTGGKMAKASASKGTAT